MIKWLHHLFNPHCSICESQYKPDAAEVLREQLAHANYEKEQMLKYIMEPQPIVHNEPTPIEEPEPIRPKIVPWNVKRAMLENEDRQKAVVIRKNEEERKKAISELEKKLNINNVNDVERSDTETFLNLETGNVQSESVKGNVGNDRKEKEIAQG
jgi:hypothetical protein